MLTVAMAVTLVLAGATPFLRFWLFFATELFNNGLAVNNAPAVLKIVAYQTTIFGRFGEHIAYGRW